MQFNYAPLSKDRTFRSEIIIDSLLNCVHSATDLLKQDWLAGFWIWIFFFPPLRKAVKCFPQTYLLFLAA